MQQHTIFDEESTTVNSRWNRLQVAHLLEQFEQSDLSLNAFAKQNNIPPNTLAYWRNRKDAIDDDPARVAFFESPSGVEFLHRLQAAVHLCFNQIGNNGIRLVCEFLELCQLNPYLATSYGAQYAYSTAMQELIIQFGEEEETRLGEQMPHKEITLAEDETFHPEICLVAMEPISNYIVVEQYEASRDADTWTVLVGAGIEAFNVEVIQVTSDAAAGIRRHAQTELGAHHSPDFFHVQQDVCAAIFPGLYAKVREAEAWQNKSEEGAQAWRDAQQAAADKRPVGRPPNYEKYIAEHEENASFYEETKAHLESRVEDAKGEVQRLRETYHPFHLETGAARKGKSAEEQLNACFDQLEELVEGPELGERSRKRLQKARRQAPAMIDTILWFWLMVGVLLKPLRLTRRERWGMEVLIASYYLGRVAERTDLAELRREYEERSAKLRSKALARDGPLGDRSEDDRAQLCQTAQQCGDLFQRSSSCVEGRNGQLSLRHHSFHQLSGRKLVCLTVLHNFWLKRWDQTTAAERFFEAKPQDLFSYLLAHLPLPSRGASPRRKDTSSASAMAA